MSLRLPILASGPVLLALGCGGAAVTPPVTANDSNILLTLRSLPARTAAVRISATLDGKPAMKSETYSPPPADGQLGVNLPPAVAGALKVSVAAVDTDGCVQGAGDLTTTLPSPQRLDAELPLIAQSPRQCGVLAPCAANTVCLDSVPVANTQTIRGLWTLAPDDIWGVGDGGLLIHFDGSGWTPNSTVTTKDLRGIWASGSNDIWAVGAAGTVLHYTNGAWTATTVGTKDLKGIWGSSPTEIWAGGEVTGGSAIMRRYNGATWTAVDTGVSAITVNAVYTSGPDFVYACGLETFGGLLLRWNGSSWNKITSYSADELRAFWGKGRTNLLVIGDGGSLVRYDDPVGWTYINKTNNTANLYGITADAQGKVYVVGDTGTVYTLPAPYNSAGLTVYTSTTRLFRSISFGSNGIGWIGGTTGFLGHMDLRP
ncbi:MAG TPA: hypothetical protein PLW65_06155 [Pseudomonadota bacterium]|nr:hypothetical protein [Pseudomonadota bacterium]